MARPWCLGLAQLLLDPGPSSNVKEVHSKMPLDGFQHVGDDGQVLADNVRSRAMVKVDLQMLLHCLLQYSKKGEALLE
jgi:hypothetical protein